MGKPNSEDPYEYECNVVCIHETPRALLVKPMDGDDEDKFWIPKSVLHDDSDVYAQGHKGKLIAYEWYAEEKGWD